MRKVTAHTSAAVWLALLLLHLLLVGCGNDDSSNCVPITLDEQLFEANGRLVSASCIGREDPASLAAIFEILDIDAEPTHAVDLYRVQYATRSPEADANDTETIASGLIVVPVDLDGPLPALTYMHGTILQRSDVPSEESLEHDVGVVFAALGYVAALPDYLGLGTDTTRLHPYVHAASEADAGVDLLRATRTLIRARAQQLSDELFITGYSQGGHAAMALHQRLQAASPAEWTVVASAPGAGPYDMSGTMLNFVLEGNTHPNPYYFPYVMLGYNPIYQLVDEAGTFFSNPYNQTLPPLFDGQTPTTTINAAMPAVVRDVIDPDFLAAVGSNPNHPLRQALRDNDLYDWLPQAPIRLYYCDGDQDVMPKNSEVAFAQLTANGAAVELINLIPGASHSACALPTLIAAQQWFDTL